MKIFTYALSILFLFGCSQANKSGDEKSDTTETETAIQSAGEAFEITLPDNAKLLDDQPMGDNWVNLLENEDNWILDEANWEINDTLLHGDYHGGELHNYGWTRQQYGDFELHAVVRMSGDEANSGVCIRINPEDANSVPGYQVDMGPGY